MVRNTVSFAVLFFTVSLLTLAFAQKKVNVDSLIQVMEGPNAAKLEPDTRMKNFLRLSDLTGRVSTTKSYRYAAKALLEAKNIPNKLGEAMALNMMAGALTNQSKYDSAEILYNQSLAILRSLNDTTGIIQITNNLGAHSKAKGHYSKAISYYKIAFSLAQKRNDKTGMILTANNLGIIYYDWKQYDIALENYHKALNLLREMGDSSRMAVLLNNIGELYKETSQVQKALENFMEALELAQRKGANMTIMNAYFNIGDVSLLQAHIKDAVQFYQLGLDEANKIQYPFGIAYANIHLGDALLKMGNNTESLKYLNLGLDLALKQNDLTLIKDAHQNLFAYYQKNGNLSKALENQLAYTKAKDSLFNQNSRKELALLRTEYETEQKEKEIKLLTQEKSIQQLEINRHKNILVYTILTAIFIFIAIYFAYSRYRITQKHIKAELERKNLETEQRLLRTQMNPHFIFNSLNSINSFIGSNEAEAARTYLTKFSLLMRLILQNSRIALINFADELNTIQLYLELEKLRFETAFNFTVACAEEIDVANTYVPPMLVQPFVENALLHGIAHRKGDGVVEVRFTLLDNAIKAVVTDNGVGRTQSALIESHNQNKKPSLGMQLTTERLASLSQQYKGKFGAILTDITDEANTVIGTKVELTMPFETE